jgi:hypothetical protein
MSISSINGVPTSSLSFWIGVSFPTLGGWNGDIVTPPTPPPVTASFITKNLMDYWNPLDAASSTTISIGGTIRSQSLNLSANYTSSLFASNGSSSLVYAGPVYTSVVTNGVTTPCYYYDGSNDYSQIYPITNPPETGNPRVTTNCKIFTVEMWVRSNGDWINGGNFYSWSGNSGNRIRPNNNTGNSPFMGYYANGMVSFGAAGSAGTAARNVWHQFVVTMTDLGANDRLRGYINGVQVFQDLTGNYAPNYNFAQIMFGSFFGSSEFQRMYVGEIRRYNRELTAAEILTNWSSSAAYYGR